MTEKQIIEVLLLELDVLVTTLESEEVNYSRPDGSRLLDDSRDYIDALRKAGYKYYPEYYQQTPAEKQEIIDRCKQLKNLANGEARDQS